MTTKDTPFGARRAMQRVARAGTQSSGPVPLSDFPAQLLEWNGRVWEPVAEATTQAEIDAFLADGPAW